MRRFLLCSAALLLGGTAHAACPVLVQNGTPVVDSAQVLDPQQEAKLAEQLRAVNAVAKHQVAVFTVATLGGEDPAMCGVETLRKWGLGGEAYNDGVLLMLAVGEHKSRIDVGYGLESVLTDAESNQINRTKMIPFFKKGDYAAGLAAGVAAIGEQINAPSVAPPPAPVSHHGSGWLWWLAGTFGAGSGITLWLRSRRKKEREAEEKRRRARREQLDNGFYESLVRDSVVIGKTPRRTRKEPSLGASYGGSKKSEEDYSSSYKPSSYSGSSYSGSSSSSDSSSSSSDFSGGGGSSGGGGDTSGW